MLIWKKKKQKKKETRSNYGGSLGMFEIINVFCQTQGCASVTLSTLHRLASVRFFLFVWSFILRVRVEDKIFSFL